MSTALILEGGKARPAEFVTAYGAETVSLVNASFDSDTGLLHSFNKGRGVADCGESDTYAWDGTKFRMTEAARMDVCRGSTEWIMVWRADVVTRR